MGSQSQSLDTSTGPQIYLGLKCPQQGLISIWVCEFQGGPGLVGLNDPTHFPCKTGRDHSFIAQSQLVPPIISLEVLATGQYYRYHFKV